MKLADYLPNEIVGIPENETILAITQGELSTLEENYLDVKKQFHIDTATWGLRLWEERYGIEYNPSVNYEQRREIVKAKKRGQGIVSKARIKNSAESFSGGEVEVIEDDDDYYFIIKFVGAKGVPSNMTAFCNMLNEIKPAHLNYEFEYTYNILNDLLPFSINDLTKYTLEELLNKKLL